MGSNDRSGPAATHVADEVDLYLAGWLTPEQEQRFEEHLLLCTACRERANQDSEVAVLVASLPGATVTEIERAGTTAPPRTDGRPTPDDGID